MQGGGTGFGPRATVDLFDAATGIWTVAALSLPREQLAAASISNYLALFAGGEIRRDFVRICDQGVPQGTAVAAIRLLLSIITTFAPAHGRRQTVSASLASTSLVRAWEARPFSRYDDHVNGGLIGRAHEGRHQLRRPVSSSTKQLRHNRHL